MSDYITSGEVCERLGISISTLYRWMAEGRLSGYRIGPRHLRFKADEVEAQLVTHVGPHSAA